jgi:hypothetical protein
VEHFNTSDSCLRWFAVTDNLDFASLGKNTTFNSSCGYSASSWDGEDI